MKKESKKHATPHSGSTRSQRRLRAWALCAVLAGAFAAAPALAQGLLLESFDAPRASLWPQECGDMDAKRARILDWLARRSLSRWDTPIGSESAQEIRARRRALTLKRLDELRAAPPKLLPYARVPEWRLLAHCEKACAAPGVELNLYESSWNEVWLASGAREDQLAHELQHAIQEREEPGVLQSGDAAEDDAVRAQRAYESAFGRVPLCEPEPILIQR